MYGIRPCPTPLIVVLQLLASGRQCAVIPRAVAGQQWRSRRFTQLGGQAEDPRTIVGTTLNSSYRRESLETFRYPALVVQFVEQRECIGVQVESYRVVGTIHSPGHGRRSRPPESARELVPAGRTPPCRGMPRACRSPPAAPGGSFLRRAGRSGSAPNVGLSSPARIADRSDSPPISRVTGAGRLARPRCGVQRARRRKSARSRCDRSNTEASRGIASNPPYTLDWTSPPVTSFQVDDASGRILIVLVYPSAPAAVGRRLQAEAFERDCDTSIYSESEVAATPRTALGAGRSQTLM
jgi:hypothetical protein